jgi:hypothetical protein
VLVRGSPKSKSLAHHTLRMNDLGHGMFAYALCICGILNKRANKPLQAGIVIAQEAGGLIRGSPSTLDNANWFTEDFLWGRKYIVVRCISFFTVPVILHRLAIVFTLYAGQSLTRRCDLSLLLTRYEI